MLSDSSMLTLNSASIPGEPAIYGHSLSWHDDRIGSMQYLILCRVHFLPLVHLLKVVFVVVSKVADPLSVLVRLNLVSIEMRIIY